MGATLYVRSLTLTNKTSGAYTANDIIGGRQQFTEVGQGNLRSITISDLAAQNVDYVVVFLSSIPTNILDDAPFDIADADLPNIIGIVSMTAAATRTAFTDNSVSHLRVELPLKSKEADGDIWVFLYTTGTPTYTTTADITLTIAVEQF